ncbi:hypothetical protein V8E54_012291 [Elaphomyces granulatus]|jgi:hypothetical protein
MLHSVTIRPNPKDLLSFSTFIGALNSHWAIWPRQKIFYFLRFMRKKEFDPSDYPSFRPWLSDTAVSYTMCSERSAIVEYYEYGHYDERPHFETSNGEIETAMGYGKCLIQLDQENSLVYDLVVNCQYNPNISCVPTKSYKALREHLRFVGMQLTVVRHKLWLQIRQVDHGHRRQRLSV